MEVRHDQLINSFGCCRNGGGRGYTCGGVGGGDGSCGCCWSVPAGNDTSDRCSCRTQASAGVDAGDPISARCIRPGAQVGPLLAFHLRFQGHRRIHDLYRVEDVDGRADRDPSLDLVLDIQAPYRGLGLGPGPSPSHALGFYFVDGDHTHQKDGVDPDRALSCGLSPYHCHRQCHHSESAHRSQVMSLLSDRHRNGDGHPSDAFWVEGPSDQGRRLNMMECMYLGHVDDCYVEYHHLVGHLLVLAALEVVVLAHHRDMMMHLMDHTDNCPLEQVAEAEGRNQPEGGAYDHHHRAAEAHVFSVDRMAVEDRVHRARGPGVGVGLDDQYRMPHCEHEGPGDVCGSFPGCVDQFHGGGLLQVHEDPDRLRKGEAVGH